MRLNSLALLCALLAAAPAAQATIDPSETGNWTESTYAIGDAPHTGLGWAPDGSDRLFVLERFGEVRVFSGGVDGGGSWSTFATIPVHTACNECGLIGFAFDPNYVSNRFVYFFVTVSSSEQRILRYRDNAGVGVDDTVLIPGLPTRGANHNGGSIGFAEDGKLYWGIGDLGNGTGVGGDADEMQRLEAKVGRANRDGSVPTDNPFNDGAGPNNDYIFARGMRNPFTMQIQPSTGQLWLNVVGTSYEQVFVVSAGDHAGYNAFENNQPAPTPSDQYITPKIVYRTNGTDTRTFSGANPPTRSAGIATFTTTAAAHGLRVGGNISITGVADASFNGANQYVASVPTPNSFTVAQAGPDATSSGGQAVTLNQGGCLTGGAFYDASTAPAAYRGNFFYGDCNSRRLLRARIDPGTNAVQRVNYFAQDANANQGQVDVAVGPDGALYYLGAGNDDDIMRARYNVTAQGLVVSNMHLRLDEDGEAAFAVSLAQAPAADVTVEVARSGGDTDVGVIAGATLVFTPSNWNTPQAVTLGAAIDGDAVDDTATISVEAPGLTTIPVEVRVLDLVQGTDEADLSISVTDNTATVVPGGTTTYVIVATSAGPDAAPGATVTDEFPDGLTCTWTCLASGGGTCTAGGSGDIGDTVNLAAAGSAVTYTATCSVDAGASGTISNTASVAAPANVSDPDLDDNTATDTSTVLGTTIFADGFEP